MDLKRIKAAKRGLETSDLCLEKHLSPSRQNLRKRVISFVSESHFCFWIFTSNVHTLVYFHGCFSKFLRLYS